MLFKVLYLCKGSVVVNEQSLLKIGVFLFKVL